jgi:hypothetical protein
MNGLADCQGLPVRLILAAEVVDHLHLPRGQVPHVVGQPQVPDPVPSLFRRGLGRKHMD